MVFSNTSTKAGILQMIERTLKLGDGFITGSTAELAYYTNLVNQWYRIAAYMAWKVDKMWKFDDENQTDFPSATTTLVDGQRDYTLPSSALKIQQVEVKDNSGNYYSLEFMQEEDYRLYNEREQEDAGVPSHFRLIGNSIILYPKPLASSVTLVAGLRVTTDREVLPFDVSGTTVTDAAVSPGLPEVMHSILYYGPCFEKATIDGNGNVTSLCTRMLGNFPGLSEMIGDFFGKRNEQQTPILSRNKHSYK